MHSGSHRHLPYLATRAYDIARHAGAAQLIPDLSVHCVPLVTIEHDGHGTRSEDMDKAAYLALVGMRER